MPQLLLLLALRVLLEVVHQVLDLLDLCIGISVDNLGKVFHETEIRSHGISKSSQLTELGNEGNLVSSASILVDVQRLIAVVDVFVVASLVVLSVACLSSVLVKGSLGTLSKVYTVNLVRLLVVTSDDSCTGESKLNRFLAIVVALLGSVSEVIHVAQAVIRTDDLEANINVQKHSLLLHDESGVKAGPHLDVMGI